MSIHLPSEEAAQVPPGTLELLILRCVADVSMHGWAISRSIKDRTQGTLLVEEGSLYPALHRLLRLRQLLAAWGTSENNRKARFYRITSRGQARLVRDTALWARVTAAVAKALDVSPNPSPLPGVT